MESPSIFIFDEEMFRLFPECVSVGEGRCNISCQSDAFLKEKIFFLDILYSHTTSSFFNTLCILIAR